MSLKKNHMTGNLRFFSTSNLDGGIIIDAKAEFKIWCEIYSSFAYHTLTKKGDTNEKTALNRIATKCTKAPDLMSIGPDTHSANEVFLVYDAFKKLVLYHDRDKPATESGSIIILAHNNEYFVIDGNTRSNKWLKEGFDGTKPAIIIQRKID